MKIISILALLCLALPVNAAMRKTKKTKNTTFELAMGYSNIDSLYKSSRRIKKNLRNKKNTRKRRNYITKNIDFLFDKTENKKPTNALSFEMLGRGIFYGVNYDHYINSKVSLGGGLAYTSYSAQPLVGSVSLDLTVIPLYSNYYFAGEVHRGFVTGGINIVWVSTSAKINADDEVTQSLPFEPEIGGSVTMPVPVMGVGYEYKGDDGFLARGSLYGFAVDGFQPWFGVSLGGIF